MTCEGAGAKPGGRRRRSTPARERAAICPGKPDADAPAAEATPGTWAWASEQAALAPLWSDERWHLVNAILGVHLRAGDVGSDARPRRDVWDTPAVTRKLCLAQEPEADALLASDYLALLFGMLLDQQISMEKAFKGPKVILDRMGSFNVHAVAEADPDEFAALVSTPPAIHRFPGSMAKRLQTLAQFMVEHYDGKVESLWKQGKPDGAEVLQRLTALPGFGDQKARIFLALLGKQMGVKPIGWREAAGAYGEEGSRRSVADVVDAKSLGEVRAFKKAAKAAAKA